MTHKEELKLRQRAENLIKLRCSDAYILATLANPSGYTSKKLIKKIFNEVKEKFESKRIVI